MNKEIERVIEVEKKIKMEIELEKEIIRKFSFDSVQYLLEDCFLIDDILPLYIRILASHYQL